MSIVKDKRKTRIFNKELADETYYLHAQKIKVASQSEVLRE